MGVKCAHCVLVCSLHLGQNRHMFNRSRQTRMCTRTSLTHIKLFCTGIFAFQLLHLHTVKYYWAFTAVVCITRLWLTLSYKVHMVCTCIKFVFISLRPKYTSVVSCECRVALCQVCMQTALSLMTIYTIQ